MVRRIARAVPVLAVLLFGCSQGATPTPTDPVTAASATGRVVIAQIVTHDTKVALLGGSPSSDLRVIVQNVDGSVVADGITLDELRARDPELYVVVTSAFASNGTSYVDATLDLGHLN